MSTAILCGPVAAPSFKRAVLRSEATEHSLWDTAAPTITPPCPTTADEIYIQSHSIIPHGSTVSTTIFLQIVKCVSGEIHCNNNDLSKKKWDIVNTKTTEPTSCDRNKKRPGDGRCAAGGYRRHPWRNGKRDGRKWQSWESAHTRDTQKPTTDISVDRSAIKQMWYEFKMWHWLWTAAFVLQSHQDHNNYSIYLSVLCIMHEQLMLHITILWYRNNN